MSKQAIKIDYVPADEQAERSRNRKGLEASAVEEAPPAELPTDDDQADDDLDDDLVEEEEEDEE